MDAKSQLEYEWAHLLSFFPPDDVLERTAKEFGAITRKRLIDKASTLLRLAFAYGFCEMSLRQTAAWAEVIDIAHISDVALMKRLRLASDWLGHLLALKLTERAPPPQLAHAARHLRLVDATTINRPGSMGTDWRVHLGFNLMDLKIDSVEVTDVHGGESLKRFHFCPHDLVVGDCGYAHRAGFHAVISAKADFLIRLNWQNVPLCDIAGDAFDILRALRSISDATPTEFAVRTQAVPKDNIPAIPARLLVIRKSEAAAKAARERVLRERSRKSRTIDPRTLEAARYIMVLTSVPADELSALDGLELYRFRWQIELAFKRLKSLLNLGEVPTKDPPLTHSYLYAKFLAALILEDLTEEFLSFSPWGHRLVRT
ncbi:MAG: IS4 family transposase [Bacteroidia bacterium]|nr:IS4 family transposase [Bacteroidia bacterium]MCZ7556774.1 IS4 family transposase [Bacteroidia bacterium]